jgi:hypothetical protein
VRIAPLRPRFANEPGTLDRSPMIGHALYYDDLLKVAVHLSS